MEQLDKFVQIAPELIVNITTVSGIQLVGEKIIVGYKDSSQGEITIKNETTRLYWWESIRKQLGLYNG